MPCPLFVRFVPRFSPNQNDWERTGTKIEVGRNPCEIS